MHPILFKIGGVTLYTHGIGIVAGIFIGALIVYFLSRFFDLKSHNLVDNIIYISLTGIIGARLVYFFLYHGQFASISQIFFLSQGGLVSYGGFIFGGLALLIIFRLQNEPVERWLDLFSVGLFSGMILGRVGDLMAGDYGSSNFLSQNIGLRSAVESNPLWEAALCFVIVILANISIYFFRDRLKEGLVFAVSVLIYSGGRFIIEFHRADPVLWLNMSLSQLFSLTIFLISVLFIALKLRESKKGNNYGIEC